MDRSRTMMLMTGVGVLAAARHRRKARVSRPPAARHTGNKDHGSYTFQDEFDARG